MKLEDDSAHPLSEEWLVLIHNHAHARNSRSRRLVWVLGDGDLLFSYMEDYHAS